LIDLDVEVNADPVLSRSLVEDLLQAHAADRVYPNGHFREVLADRRVFGSQFELFGLHAGLAVHERLRTQIFDIPFLFEFLASGAKAEHEPALVLAEFAERGDLVGDFFIELHDSAGVSVSLRNRLAVHLVDVRRHLEGRALALVVDRAGLHLLVGDRLGGDRVELEVGGGGMEVLRRFVELAQHSRFFLVVVGIGSGKGGAKRRKSERDESGKNQIACDTHEFP